MRRSSHLAASFATLVAVVAFHGAVLAKPVPSGGGGENDKQGAPFPGATSGQSEEGGNEANAGTSNLSVDAAIRSEALAEIDKILGGKSSLDRLNELRKAKGGSAAVAGGGAGGDGSAPASSSGRQSPVVKVLQNPLLRSVLTAVINANAPNNMLLNIVGAIVSNVLTGEAAAESALEEGAASGLTTADYEYFSKSDQNLQKLREGVVALRKSAQQHEGNAEASNDDVERILSIFEYEYQAEQLKNVK